MFLLNRNTVLLPFEQLVQAMRSTLVNVNPSIIKEGRLNAKQSESFLAKRHTRPYHVLTNLARSMKLHEKTKEELQKLRMEVLRDRQKRKEKEVEIDIEKLAGDLVRGLHSDMILLEDGKVVSLSSQEAKDLDIKPKSRSTDLDAPTDRPFRMRNHRNVQRTLSHDPFVSQTRDMPMKPALNPLSNWNTIDTLKYTPPVSRNRVQLKVGLIIYLDLLLKVHQNRQLQRKLRNLISVSSGPQESQIEMSLKRKMKEIILTTGSMVQIELEH